jgi:phosphate transport system permease protein
LLFTSLGSQEMSLDMTQPMASVPMAIVRYSNTAFTDWVAMAWTGAMLITVGVLLLNILSRFSYAAVAGKQGA